MKTLVPAPAHGLSLLIGAPVTVDGEPSVIRAVRLRNPTFVEYLCDVDGKQEWLISGEPEKETLRIALISG